jgi:hypothetical protein
MKKIILVFTFLISGYIYSQGCSDAGFCTLDNMKSNAIDSLSYKNNFKIGTNIGAGENDISVFGSYLEYNNAITSKFAMSLKVVYQSQSLDGVTSSALSDAYINGSFKVNETTKAIVGFKIPFTDGNLKKDGIALPMDFQPSLGTFDLIIGATKKVNNFNFVLALQQPLSQNKNEYIGPYYSTNNFKRKGDALFRATYNYKISDKFTVSPSLLPIYHLGEDKYTDALGNEQSIDGSDGLTLNGNVFLNYNINAKNALELSFGTPFVIRDARPDGLTRAFVANLEYKISF